VDQRWSEAYRDGEERFPVAWMVQIELVRKRIRGYEEQIGATEMTWMEMMMACLSSRDGEWGRSRDGLIRRRLEQRSVVLLCQ
jgi:hypothetical protein